MVNILIALLLAVGLASVGSLLSRRGLAALRKMQIFPDKKPAEAKSAAQIDTRGPSFDPSPEGDSPLFWPSEKREDSEVNNELFWPSNNSAGRYRTSLIDYDDMKKLAVDPNDQSGESALSPPQKEKPEGHEEPVKVDVLPETNPEPVLPDPEIVDGSKRPSSDEVRALVRRVGLSQAVQRIRNSEGMSFQEATEFLAQSLRR